MESMLLCRYVNMISVSVYNMIFSVDSTCAFISFSRILNPGFRLEFVDL